MMLNERYADILAKDADPRTMNVVQDLDAIFSISTSATVRDSIAAVLTARATEFRFRPAWLRRFPAPRLAAVAAVAVLVVGSMIAYVHQQRPAPVSAQTILYRAMAVNRLPPNQTTHLVYAVDGQPQGRGTFDVWRQAGAGGNITRMAVTFTIRTPLPGKAPPRGRRGRVFMVQRAVLTHGRGQVYQFNPQANTVTIKPATIHDLDVSGISLFDPARLARQLLAAGAGKESHVHLLPQRTLHGRTVDVLQTDWSGPASDRGRYTIYVNARTYLFVGLDLQGTEHGQVQTGTFRVTTDQTLSNSAVPKGTFALSPPRGARVVSGP